MKTVVELALTLREAALALRASGGPQTQRVTEQQASYGSRIKGAAVGLAAKRVRERLAADRGLRKRIEVAQNEFAKRPKQPDRAGDAETAG